MKNIVSKIVLVSLVFVTSHAWAKPTVSVDVIAEKEIVEMVKGKKVTKKVLATKVEPGEVIFYTLKFKNTGNEAALNIKFDNPISKDMSYVDKSAYGENSTILFSVDQKNFAQAGKLTFVQSDKAQTKEIVARPGDFRAIRWVMDEIKPGESGSVGFQGRVRN